MHINSFLQKYKNLPPSKYKDILDLIQYYANINLLQIHSNACINLHTYNLLRHKIKLLKFISYEKIIEKIHFYGLELKINKHVLQPRLDSETLVNVVLKAPCLNYANTNNVSINMVDLCTGSACIIMAIQYHLPPHIKISLWAVDKSKQALKVAKQNINSFNMPINLLCLNVLKNISSFLIKNNINFIVSNPPYVTHQSFKNAQARGRDPRVSLLANGLKFYKHMAKLTSLCPKLKWIALECGYGDAEKIIHMFELHNFKLINFCYDQLGHKRALLFEKLATE